MRDWLRPLPNSSQMLMMANFVTLADLSRT
jgi:hypothetical protein